MASVLQRTQRVVRAVVPVVLRKSQDGWIGCDLDGTLAEYHGWQGMAHVGPAVPRMLARVKAALADGEDVRIFTARAEAPEGIAVVKRWLARVGLPDLPVTNRKDMACKAIWDDRARQVQPNTGEFIV